MKTYTFKSLNALLFIAAFGIIGIANGTATAAGPPRPDLAVQTWQGSSTPLVESPYQYTTRVRNIGNQAAQNVTITVEFPLTATSPNQHILGKLSSIQPSHGSCSIVANRIRCSVGNIGNNQTRQVTFTFEFQVATTPPTFRTTAATTSFNEFNQNNNSLPFTPAIRYPDNVVSGGSYLVTSCTGTNLTSFYECELYQSSQQQFSMELIYGGTLTIPQAPGYFGFWDQNSLPSDKTLHFTIDGGNGTEVEFNGFAISGACFEGITTFPGNTAYNSAYKVCEQ